MRSFKQLFLVLIFVQCSLYAQIYHEMSGDPYVTLNNPVFTKELCDRHFVGTFYWNSMFGDMCVHDLAGVTINKDVLDFAIDISRNYRETARAILLNAANRSVESKTFKHILNHLVGETGIALQNTHLYVVAIAGAKFDLEYLKLCQSRTVLSTMINPIISSRTLNMKNILSCIYNLRDVKDVGLGTSLSLSKCKMIPTLTARLECIGPVVEKWNEKQKNKSTLLERFRNHLDSVIKD